MRLHVNVFEMQVEMNSKYGASLSRQKDYVTRYVFPRHALLYIYSKRVQWI